MYIMDSAHVFHVAKTGSDSNSGKAAQYPINLANDAKLTIASAITAAASGDTIILWPGDYATGVTFGSKSLRLVGLGHKSRIIPAAATGITASDNSYIGNLAVEAIGQNRWGIDITGKTNVRIENCDIYGDYDGLYGYGANQVFLRDCRIRGKYDGASFSDAVGVVAERCTFAGLGTYVPTTDCRALLGVGVGTYINCVFTSERSDTTTEDIGGIYCEPNSLAVFKNCVIKAVAGSGHTGAAYGVGMYGSGGVVVLENCVITCASPNATSGPFDLRQQTGKIVVANCAYQTSSGLIIRGDPSVNKAIKTLVNKVVQNKSTGVMQVYDDDGSTVLATLTPSEDESTITLTPS